MTKKELGIYIHIPFCKQKCYYCDFVSYANKEELQERYINCVKKELEYKCKEIPENTDITTIYIGGGTPSFIDSKYIKELLEVIKSKSKDVEITIEVNPGTVTEQKLKEYRDAGINRLSIGLQSASDKLLKEIGRIHTFEEFRECYDSAREVGFDNINVDLMLGLPNQTIKELRKSLREIIRLEPEHVSVYSLILEEGTKLYELIQSNELQLPDEDLEREMYWFAKDSLEIVSYEHYEISNFAKEGYRSKHNVNCWKQKEYIGVGVAASSYFDGTRYSNISDINEYIKNIEAGDVLKNKVLEEVQEEADMQKEFMLLGLRMIEGVSVQEFKSKFGKNLLYIFREELNKLVNNKLVIIEGDSIKLTDKGLDLANQVWMEFA